jgi:radical SAM superfamily enzyme YgiQ (UPF0313 family)
LGTGVRTSESEVVSAALAVVLRQSALTLVSYDGREPLSLGVGELLLLAALAGTVDGPIDEVVADAEGRAGLEPGALAAFVVELRERRLLRPCATRRAPHPAQQADPSDEVAEARPDGVHLMALTPLVLQLTERGFELVDHDGGLLLRLDAPELAALTEFRVATLPAEAMERHRAAAGPGALDAARFAALVVRLSSLGILVHNDRHGVDGRESREARAMYRFYLRMSRAVTDACDEQERLEVTRSEAATRTRVPVVPIDDHANPMPLALGMIVAHALAYKGGMLTEHYRFVPDWLTRRERLSSRAREAGIYLFSNYLWSHGQNLAYSELVKRVNAASVTIHGGPDTPKYEPDVEAYFRENPHVDVAVHGEGEQTSAELLEVLVDALGDGPPDLSPLRDVPGLSYRDGNHVVRTEKRDRLAELDVIPSPFLTGVFDVHAVAGASMAILETNRGCPYGCTFCDWGSATLSRIRKFDLERVFAELEWCAQRRIPRIFLADANFGIIERDVEIAEKVAELKATYGFPALFSTNYAKNTTKHLRQIVGVLSDAGILNQGLLSLQSMDGEVLKTVKRSNIKTAKYDELAREFRAADLPLFVDLMLGLPGATQESFRADLQGCIDREVTAKIYPTELLVNSPMNEPGYRTENRIETSAPLGGLVKTSRNPDGTTKRALVVATSSFTRKDYEEMLQLRRVFIVADNFGVLRQVSRFVRQETGLPEIELYERLRLDARARPDEWPSLAFTFNVVPFLGMPPISWRFLIDEVRKYLTNELRIADNSALETVLRVQHALLPTPRRSFPVSLELAHDYPGWHRAMVDVKDSGHADWERRVPRLRDFAPTVVTVDDPNDICGRGLGFEIDENAHASWELGSPLARAVSHEHLWDAEAS